MYDAALSALKPGLFPEILENVILPHAPAVMGSAQRAECAIGLTRIFAEVPSLLADASQHRLLAALLASVAELLDPGARAPVAMGSLVEEADTGDLVEEAVSNEYAAAFSKLYFAGERSPHNAFSRTVPEPKLYFGRTVAAAAAAAPGSLPALLTTSPVAAAVAGYVAAAGGAIV